MIVGGLYRWKWTKLVVLCLTSTVGIVIDYDKTLTYFKNGDLIEWNINSNDVDWKLIT
jgi:hypothetical protein